MSSCFSTICWKDYYCSIIFCQRSVGYISVDLFLGSLFCAVDLFVYSFTNIHCLDYCTFTVSLELGSVIPPTCSFPSIQVLATLVLLLLHVNFRIRFLTCWHFHWEFTESVDKAGRTDILTVLSLSKNMAYQRIWTISPFLKILDYCNLIFIWYLMSVKHKTVCFICISPSIPPKYPQWLTHFADEKNRAVS